MWVYVEQLLSHVEQVCLSVESVVLITPPSSSNLAGKAVFLYLMTVVKYVVWWTKLKGTPTDHWYILFWNA